MKQQVRVRVWLSSLLLGTLLAPMLPLQENLAHADPSLTPPLTATHDGHIQGDTSNNALATEIIVKNACSALSFNRVGFVRFKYDPDYVWTSASFEMVVSQNEEGQMGKDWGVTYTTFNVKVWGLSDASWDESTLTFANATAVNNGVRQPWGISSTPCPWDPNDTNNYLGEFAVPAKNETVGQTFSLANQALVDFLNNDDDGEVTL